MDDTVKPDPALIERMVRERVDAILDERLEAKLAALREARTPAMRRAMWNIRMATRTTSPRERLTDRGAAGIVTSSWPDR